MPTYIGLATRTDQGNQNLKGAPSRAGRVREMIEKVGGSIRIFGTPSGPFDAIAVMELPDEEKAAAVALGLTATGDYRVRVVRAYEAGELTRIFEDLP